jgi:hypothetical protein
MQDVNLYQKSKIKTLIHTPNPNPEDQNPNLKHLNYNPNAKH